MKHEVVIPKRLKIGGLDIRIDISPKITKELIDKDCYGDSTSQLQRIRLDELMTPQRLSGVFIHECVHIISDIYSADKLTEGQVNAVENGLLQVMEQLGVRFVAKENL